MKNKKIFPILIASIVLVGSYFAFWKTVANKLEKVVYAELTDSNITFKDIKAFGFPFSKNVEITNLELRDNTGNIAKDYLKAKKITLSSSVFGSLYTISLDNISHYDAQRKEDDKIIFNTEPKIKVSLYKTGEVKNFSYKDTGFRIVDKRNKDLYSSKSSDFNINTILTDDISNHSVKFNFQDIKNLGAPYLYDGKMVTDSFDLQADLSVMFKAKAGKTTEGTLKIEHFSIENSVRGIAISLKSDINFNEEDPMAFGYLRAQVNNFDKFLSTLVENIETMQKINPEKTAKENALVISNLLERIELIKALSRKNKETDDKKVVFLIKRPKNGLDYLINGESLMAFLSKQAKIGQESK